MTTHAEIETLLTEALTPTHLEVVNESHQHNVPSGSESHFRVVCVSPLFEGKSLLERHQQVNQILAEILENTIHALALHTYTDSEWTKKKDGAPASPPCRGGEKEEA